MAMLVAIMGWAATMAGLAVTVVMIPSSTIVGEYCIWLYCQAPYIQLTCAPAGQAPG